MKTKKLISEVSHIKKMMGVKEQFNGDVDPQHDITKEDLNTLKKINYSLPRKDVIDWFNENDIDYMRMTDVEMYIQYIEEHLK